MDVWSREGADERTTSGKGLFGREVDSVREDRTILSLDNDPNRPAQGDSVLGVDWDRCLSDPGFVKSLQIYATGAEFKVKPQSGIQGEGAEKIRERGCC